ncbi:MAG: hypothetical protein JOY63_03790 [Acetobacteraceae bacterium]|nr:hypothetical protein [Acetobacteraceae bacterium]
MNDMTLPPTGTAHDAVVGDICRLNWSGLDRSDVSAVAWAYYFFSIQFRENLRLAQQLRPGDPALERLAAEECDTDNLSPWPGVAEAGERLNHDEFMRRVLALSPIEPAAQRRVEQAGQRYLAGIRAMDPYTRAAGISSYEDGGLERIFGAILNCACWDTPLLQGFRHFVVKHIGFDSDPDQGHGSLVRHLPPDEGVAALWDALHQLFVTAVPRLADAQHGLGA